MVKSNHGNIELTGNSRHYRPRGGQLTEDITVDLERIFESIDLSTVEGYVRDGRQEFDLAREALAAAAPSLSPSYPGGLN